MSKDTLKYDRIDRYLRNELSEPELFEFEENLRIDEALKEKVALRRLIVNEIINQEEFYEIIGERPGNQSIKIVSINRTLLYSVSIAAVLLIMFIFIQPHKFSNNKLYDQYAYATPFEKEIVVGSDELLRGEECSLPGLNIEECREVKRAFNLYNLGKYDQAKEIFLKIEDLKEKNIELVFYLSICQIETNELKSAIENLKFLQSKIKVKDVVNFQLALALVKDGQNSNARSELQNIIDRNEEFSPEAQEILKKLRWF